MEHERFCFIVKQRRKALDLTQDALARQVGCAAVTIQKIEEGRRRPSKHVAALLAEHLAIADEEREAFLRLARGLPVEGSLRPLTPAQDRTPPSLPAPLTRLIGRAAETAAVCNLLDDPHVRLVTLIGPPGVGKTRLSLQVAADLHAAFAAGVWFVPLAPITDADLVLPTIVEALGLGGAGAQRAMERLKATIRAKQMLCVLDNFEQVVDAAPLVTELLTACPQLKVLTTSRVPLHVYGEHEYAVEPFAVPDPASMSAPEHLMANEAVRLFVARVQAFKPRFAVQAGNAQAILEICTQLDGLPLAIELAAARVRQFTPEALAAHLSHADSNPLPMLSGGPRDLPARQQTLERAIAWSYDLLDAAQQQLFRRMAVFVGGCATDALTAVCQLARSDGATALLEHSLVRQETLTQVGRRWTMLEMIRAYAQTQLEQAHERAAMEQAHATYFLHQAEHVADEAAWLDRMEQDHDNLRAALRWSITHDPAVTGLRLCTALWWYWETSGYWSEGRQWTEEMLAAAGDVPLRLRMEALRCSGNLAWKQGDLATAATLLTESLALSRMLNDPSVTAYMLMIVGKIALDAGEYMQAASWLHQSVVMRHDLGMTAAGPLCHLAEVALAQEQYSDAWQLGEASLAESRRSDDDESFFIALALRMQGEATLALGDHQHARHLLIQSVTISRTVRHTRVVAFALAALAGAMGYAPAIEDVYCAACIWSAIETVREKVGIFLPVAVHTRFDRYRSVARARLGADIWAAAWAEGHTMSLEQAIARALAEDY